MYKSYADAAYYRQAYGGDMLPEDSIEHCLKTASRHIDALTFNRIAGRGIESLTEYQQEIIKECCCEMADFEHENEDMINSVLQSYALNGVSMQFGEGWNLKIQNGVAIKRDIYAKLQSTGLCCLSLSR